MKSTVFLSPFSGNRVRIHKTRGIAFALALQLAAGALLPAWAADHKIAYPELKTASGFSRVVQTMSGFTPLSGWIANRIIRKELAKTVKGDLHSRLTLFSGTDLLGGKAKTLTISGKNVVLDEFIPLSEFHFESDRDMPFFVKKGRRPILLRPVRFKVSAVMTESDINRMLQSEKGRNRLTAIKVKLPPFGKQSMDVLNPAVSLDGNRVTIQSLMNIHDAPPENALPIKVSGHLSAKKSRLSLSDLDLQIEGIHDTEAIEQLVEDYFSELVNLNRIKVDRHRLNVAIEESELKYRQLHLKATVTVAPERKALEKALSASKQ